MSKMSLLELTQDILNSLSSDEVNSISDTPDSVQVAQIIKGTYDSFLANRNWPHTRKLIQLQPSGDSTLPTHVVVQDSVKELCFVNYDCAKLDDGSRKMFKTMKWKEPDDFLRYLNMRNNTQPNTVGITDPTSGVYLIIKTDQAPTCFTSFDDKTLIFDSYDSSVDDTIQQSKFQAMAYVTPTWIHSDSAIPDLPEEAFPGFLAECTSVASLRLNQAADQKAEQNSQRQQTWLARKAWRVNGGVKYPNFGRTGSYHRDPTFKRDETN